jgi:dihydroorotate dehydrogenase (fumarate)
MVDLRTRYLGLDLRSPLVASASPLTGSLDDLRRLEAAGAAAVVLPSLFAEQLTMEAQEVGRLLEAGAESLPAAVAWTTTTPGRTATWPWSTRPRPPLRSR